jgi:hypothetical protein
MLKLDVESNGERRRDLASKSRSLGTSVNRGRQQIDDGVSDWTNDRIEIASGLKIDKYPLRRSKVGTIEKDTSGFST